MLDQSSLKIIMELSRDGRASNAKLAQTLGYSVITIAKKLNALIDDGVISIKAIPNPDKMGYKAAAFIGLQVSLKSLDAICAQLIDNVHINLLVTCFGRFDVLLIVYFREWQMLRTFIKADLPRIPGINHIETYLVSEAKQRNHGTYPVTPVDNKPIDLDEIDEQLIQELIRNGRPSYVDLAKKVGISVSTVSRRIASLLKDKTIEIVAIPNPSKLGYSASAFVNLRVDLSQIDAICNQLSSYPEVHMVMKLMNDFDIMFGVNITNPEALYDFFRNKIANVSGILSTETFICGNFLYFSAGALFMPSKVTRP